KDHGLTPTAVPWSHCGCQTPQHSNGVSQRRPTIKPFLSCRAKSRHLLVLFLVIEQTPCIDLDNYLSTNRFLRETPEGPAEACSSEFTPGDDAAFATCAPVYSLRFSLKTQKVLISL